MDSLNVLREFVEDIERVYVSEEGKVDEEKLGWPGLMITYRHAKEVLSKHKSKENFRRKVTMGSVIQIYDDSGNCISQDFFAEGAVDWIDEDGEFIPTPVHNCQSFDMVIPKK